MLAAVPFLSLPRLYALALAALAAALTTLAVTLGNHAGATSEPFTVAPLPAAATAPLPFVPNHGQTDPRVRYEARAGDTAFFFTDRGAKLVLPATGGDGLAAPAFGASGYAVGLDFVGASAGTAVTARGRTSATVSYLGGAHAQSALPTYDSLAYAGVWPGVDVSMAGQAGQLKYAFAVAPGADPSAIGLNYAGATSLAVAPDGSLTVATPVAR